MEIVAAISYYLLRLVPSAASPSACCPPQLSAVCNAADGAQRAVPAQGAGAAVWEMKGQQGTEEQAEARGRCFGKHQEHVAVRRVLEQSSPGGEKYFVQKQMAVTGILLRLVFALGNSGWHFMAVRKLALPHR